MCNDEIVEVNVFLILRSVVLSWNGMRLIDDEGVSDVEPNEGDDEAEVIDDDWSSSWSEWNCPWQRIVEGVTRDGQN